MTDYVQFLGAHYECNESSGGLLEVESRLATDWTEQNVVGSVADGIIGLARDLPAANDAFSRSVLANDPFDLTSSQKNKSTFNAWVRTDSSATNQLVAEQVGTTEQEKAWLLRNVHQFGGGVTGAFVAFRDNVGADYDFSWTLPAAGFAAGQYPIGEWCMIGWSTNFTADRASAWFYTQTKGQYFRSFTGLALHNVFDYTTRGVSWIGFNQSGGSSGASGPLGDLDHIDMYDGIEFEQRDVNRFWNGGIGRVYPSGYIISTPGFIPVVKLGLGGRETSRRFR